MDFRNRNEKSASQRFLLAIVVTLLLMPFAASAGQTSLIINGKAWHIGTDKHYNEKNWGAGVQYDFDVVGDNWIPFVTASGFKDSNNNPSYYAGGGYLKRFAISSDYHVDIGAIAFLMQREGYKNDNPFLGALPVLSIGTQKVAVNITYIPSVDPKWVPLWFFQLKVALPQ
ncbi:MAG: hypothetical protein HY308_14605 [Gammaproteobacteria bacterium]|nr:hypothetical protein [Gammaproteobacteria bacterium]